jgi:ankyrin repeat protein
MLHRAARIYDEKAIRLLIEKGAEVNIEDDGGETPLHIAAFYGRVQNVEALLEGPCFHVPTCFGC